MPYKLRNDRRHKFKKARYKITNWSEYNEALKKRASITLWLSNEVIQAWYVDKKSRKSVADNLNIPTLLSKRHFSSKPFIVYLTVKQRV